MSNNKNNNNMYYVLLQAFGDNVISLYLLSQSKGIVNIIGTQHTKEIASLIGLKDKFNIRVLFQDIPAFYNIKQNSLFTLIKSIYKFRKFIKKERIKMLVFEKHSKRSNLLTCGLANFYSISITKHVYINRKHLIMNCTKTNIVLKSSVTPPIIIKKILINPIARVIQRNIKHNDFKIMLKLLKDVNCTIQLIDYTGEYSMYKEYVEEYYDNTSLEDVKDLLIKSDFFIGTDSFLIHLAYYCEKPFFIIMNYQYLDFLPPCSEVIGNYIISSSTDNMEKKYRKIFNELRLL